MGRLLDGEAHRISWRRLVDGERWEATKAVASIVLMRPEPTRSRSYDVTQSSLAFTRVEHDSMVSRRLI